jgi:tripartite-type tricarboxylate transporter receptor subunit TctC
LAHAEYGQADHIRRAVAAGRPRSPINWRARWARKWPRRREAGDHRRNKPGASGFIGAEAVKKAAPTATRLHHDQHDACANEHLYKKLPYDPVKDYLPVTGLGKGGQIMIVNPNVPAKSVAEFIALAKAQPGKISFGSGSSSSRVAGEMFQQMAGVELLHVPYKSNPLAINDLLGGQINMMITDMATGLPQVKGGKVRPLGVSTLKRSPLTPDIPTISEAGLKGYDMSFWFAAYVPANTPPAVVAKLHDLLVEATKGPAMQQYYSSTGTDPFVTTPAELGKFQLAESDKWSSIIKKAGIEPE